MELIRKTYFDEEDMSAVGERFWVNDEEIDSDEYAELLGDCVMDCENEVEIEYLGSECSGEENINAYENYKEEAEMILAWGESVISNPTSCNIFAVLIDVYETGKRIGVRDSKLEMIERLSEDIEILDE